MTQERKTLVLHVGFHKTGSSTLQWYLAAANRELSRAGFHYPMLSRGAARVNHSIALRHLYFKESVNKKIAFPNSKSLKFTERRWRKCLSGDASVILSAEDVSIFPEDSLRNFASDLRLAGFDVKVVAVVRPPFHSLASFIQQRVKSGAGQPMLRNSKMSSIFDRIERLKKVFCDVQLIPFNSVGAYSGGVCGLFREQVLGLPGLGKMSIRINESISNEAVRLIAWVNSQLGPAVVEGRLNPKRVSGDLLILHDLPGQKFRLCLGEVLPRRHWIDLENRKLAEHCGSEFCDESVEYYKFPRLHDESFLNYGEDVRNYLETHLIRLTPEVRGEVLRYFKEGPHSKIVNFNIDEIEWKRLDLDGCKYRVIDWMGSFWVANSGGQKILQFVRIFKQTGFGPLFMK